MTALGMGFQFGELKTDAAMAKMQLELVQFNTSFTSKFGVMKDSFDKYIAGGKKTIDAAMVGATRPPHAPRPPWQGSGAW